MNVLFDTQSFLWWCVGHSKLSPAGLTAIDEADEVFLSPVTFWEIGIKQSGKGFDFPVPDHWEEVLTTHAKNYRVTWLPISPTHCRKIQDLPFHHRDPFDRMIIAQALEGDLSVLTSDRHFKEYGVEVIW